MSPWPRERSSGCCASTTARLLFLVVVVGTLLSQLLSLDAARSMPDLPGATYTGAGVTTMLAKIRMGGTTTVDQGRHSDAMTKSSDHWSNEAKSTFQENFAAGRPRSSETGASSANRSSIDAEISTPSKSIAAGSGRAENASQSSLLPTSEAGQPKAEEGGAVINEGAQLGRGVAPSVVGGSVAFGIPGPNFLNSSSSVVKNLARCPAAFDWVQVSIAQQLSPWNASGVTEKMFHGAMSYSPSIGGRQDFEVRSGAVKKGMDQGWGEYLRRAVARWPYSPQELLDFKVVGEMADWPFVAKSDPGASPSKVGPSWTNANNGLFHSVLMPVMSRPQFGKEFKDKRKKTLALAAKVPWKQRKDVAVWRGNLGCGIGCGPRGASYYPNNHLDHCVDDSPHWDPDKVGFVYGCGESATERTGAWMNHPRIRLANMSVMHGRRCGFDAGFGGISSEHSKFIHSYIPDPSPMVRPFMNDEGTAAHKYVFHVGNNGYSDRSWRMFALGNLVLLIDNGWREWYFSFLQPFVHYIPIREDSSDICERLQWAREHPVEAEAIANRGRQFIEDCLSESLVDLYVAEMARQLGVLWKRGH